MKPEELRRHVERYRDRAEEARRAMDQGLRQVVPAVAMREVDRLRKAEADALRLLIVSELAAGMMDDPDSTTAWMLECVEAGEIIERTPSEDW